LPVEMSGNATSRRRRIARGAGRPSAGGLGETTESEVCPQLTSTGSRLPGTVARPRRRSPSPARANAGHFFDWDFGTVTVATCVAEFPAASPRSVAAA